MQAGKKLESMNVAWHTVVSSDLGKACIWLVFISVQKLLEHAQHVPVLHILLEPICGPYFE